MCDCVEFCVQEGMVAVNKQCLFGEIQCTIVRRRVQEGMVAVNKQCLFGEIQCTIVRSPVQEGMVAVNKQCVFGELKCTIVRSPVQESMVAKWNIEWWCNARALAMIRESLNARVHGAIVRSACLQLLAKLFIWSYVTLSDFYTVGVVSFIAEGEIHISILPIISTPSVYCACALKAPRVHVFFNESQNQFKNIYNIKYSNE